VKETEGFHSEVFYSFRELKFRNTVSVKVSLKPV
jgi:hypothetical protein